MSNEKMEDIIDPKQFGLDEDEFFNDFEKEFYSIIENSLREYCNEIETEFKIYNLEQVEELTAIKNNTVKETVPIIKYEIKRIKKIFRENFQIKASEYDWLNSYYSNMDFIKNTNNINSENNLEKLKIINSKLDENLKLYNKNIENYKVSSFINFYQKKKIIKFSDNEGETQVYNDLKLYKENYQDFLSEYNELFDYYDNNLDNVLEKLNNYKINNILN